MRCVIIQSQANQVLSRVDMKSFYVSKLYIHYSGIRSRYKTRKNSFQSATLK